VGFICFADRVGAECCWDLTFTEHGLWSVDTAALDLGNLAVVAHDRWSLCVTALDL
jgi:hypothetical protein